MSMQREFIHYNRDRRSQLQEHPNHSWDDEVSFYCIEDGVSHEFALRWYYLYPSNVVRASLEITNDAWKGLLCIQDVL